MPGHPAAPRPDHPLRTACPPFDLSTLELRRWDLLGRLSAVINYTGPVLFGVATQLAACRLTFLLRLVKPTDEPMSNPELDPA